jgi:hypothetical protein
MKFDYDILFEFLPEEDKKSFMVWDDVFCKPNGLDAKLAGVSRIVAAYRLNRKKTSPFGERIFIPLSKYELRLKQKERDNKIETLGI